MLKEMQSENETGKSVIPPPENCHSCSKNRMSSSYNRNPMVLKNPAQSTDFFAEHLSSGIMTAADAQMYYIRMPIQQILNLFIQTCILTWKMTTSAAFHKGQYFNIFPLIKSKCLCPAVQGSKAATPCAYILSLGTG